MLEEKDFLQTVQDFASSHFGYSGPQLTLETEWEALGVDSLGVVELVAELEDKYRASVPNAEIERLKKIGDAFQLIRAQV